MIPTEPANHTGVIVVSAVTAAVLVALLWIFFAPAKREKPVAITPRPTPPEIPEEQMSNDIDRVIELAELAGLTTDGTVTVFVPEFGHAPRQVTARNLGSDQHDNGWLLRYFSGQLRIAPLASHESAQNVCRARYQPV